MGNRKNVGWNINLGAQSENLFEFGCVQRCVFQKIILPLHLEEAFF